MGPNGSGKSTLMRMLIGVVPRSGGSANVDGVELAGDGTAVRQRCTYAPGEIALYGEMRGDEHLDWFLRGREKGGSHARQELAAAFELPLRKARARLQPWHEAPARLLGRARAARARAHPRRALGRPRSQQTQHDDRAARARRR
jgi:ABC-type transporter Mla maintaining outer membrane lipid asymmetry ATPase subunit MlaF